MRHGGQTEWALYHRLESANGHNGAAGQYTKEPDAGKPNADGNRHAGNRVGYHGYAVYIERVQGYDLAKLVG